MRPVPSCTRILSLLATISPEMSEERQESRSATGAAALHGAGGHVEDARCLSDRITLHVHKHEGRSLVGRQSAQGLEELSMEIVTLGWRGSRLMGLQELLEPLGVVDR